MKDHAKLIAFDLDGTLAESKQRLSPEMGELLARLLSRVYVAVMSGASFAQFEKQFLPAIPETEHLNRLFIFPTNAAQCYSYENGSWVIKYDRSFNLFEKGRIMQAIKESLEEARVVDANEQVWGERIEDRGAQISFSGLGQQAPLEAKKAWDPTGEKKRKIREALIKRIPDFSVSASGMTTVDITQKGVDKAYGIRRLVEMIQISVAEMLFIGDALEDGGNDSVVKQTGIHTIEVFGPDETANIIEEMMK